MESATTPAATPDPSVETPEQRKARISAARRAAALKSAEVRRRNSKRNQQPTETPEQKRARISKQCREAALKGVAVRRANAKPKVKLRQMCAREEDWYIFRAVAEKENISMIETLHRVADEYYTRHKYEISDILLELYTGRPDPDDDPMKNPFRRRWPRT